MSYDTQAHATEAGETPPSALHKMWMPSPLDSLRSQAAQAREIRASMDPGWEESRRLAIEGTIVGHSSPRWRHPGRGDPRALNAQLSEARADEVRALLEEMLRESFGARASIEVLASGVESSEPRGGHEQDGSAQMSGVDPALDDVMTGGVGDQEARAAGAGADMDAPGARRVDLVLRVTHDLEGEAGSQEGLTERYTQPAACQSRASRRWAVKLSVSGGAGHLGPGGAFAVGQLRNLTTGEFVSGSFVGAGLGAGLQTPGADPGWGDWTTFETERPLVFDDFHRSHAGLATIGLGAAFVGYAWTWLSFPGLGVDSIFVGGFNVGAVGADASTNTGVWLLDNVPPAEQCRPETERVAEATQTIPVPYSRTSNETHRVSIDFELGSARVGDAGFEQLQRLAAEIAASCGSPR